MPTPGFHHLAFACRDVEETRHFYEDLMGYPLVYTEVSSMPEGDGWIRHLFFDLGDGSCMAFFDLHEAGEKPDWSSAVSTGLGLPVWVNHVAFNATSELQDEVRGRMDDAGIKPLMEIDHGWCHSLYYVDPNKIMVELCRTTTGFVPNREEALARLTAEPSAEHDMQRAKTHVS